MLGKGLDLFFPINKNLWTSSYVIFTAGYAMLVLAACYWLIDVRGWRAWSRPFLVLGMNSILAFTLSTWVAKNIYLIYRTPMPDGTLVSVATWAYRGWFAPLFSDPRNSSLLFALTYLGFWMAVMWWLHARKIYVKI